MGGSCPGWLVLRSGRSTSRAPFLAPHDYRSRRAARGRVSAATPGVMTGVNPDVPAAGLSDRGPTDPHHNNGAHDENTTTHDHTGRPADPGESQARRSVDKRHV